MDKCVKTTLVLADGKSPVYLNFDQDIQNLKQARDVLRRARQALAMFNPASMGPEAFKLQPYQKAWLEAKGIIEELEGI